MSASDPGRASAAGAPRPPSRALRHPLLPALLLVAAGAALYYPVLGHAFVSWDDPIFFAKNVALEHGLSAKGIAWAFTSTRAANWFPLTRLSFLLDHDLHGTSAAGAHAQNLLLHLASGVLLFLAWRRMTGRTWASAALAAVFLLHPLNVESVAWAAERKGVLAGFFWMLALWVYAGVDAGALGWRRGLVLAGVVALGLMSKLVLVTLPAVLLLLDFWPLRRLGPAQDPTGARRFDRVRVGRAVLEKLALTPLVLAATGLVFVAQRAGGAVVGLERVPPTLRVSNALVSYARYLRRFVWPEGLAPFYPYPRHAYALWLVAAVALGLAAATAGAVLQARRRPWLPVGWLWFLVTLVPTLGLVQLGSAALADRYAYLPGIGLALLAVWSLAEVVERDPRLRLAGVAGAVVVLGLLAGASRAQLATWRDSDALFAHTLEVTQDNYVAYEHLGHALFAEGRLVEAVAAYRESLRIQPRQPALANNLAWLLATHPSPALRNPREALALAQSAVRQTGGKDPGFLDTLAAAQAAAGRFAAARQTAQSALVLAQLSASPLEAGIRARLALYAAGRIYTEPPAPFPMANLYEGEE